MKTRIISFIVLFGLLFSCKKEGGQSVNNPANLTVSQNANLSLDQVKQWVGNHADTASAQLLSTGHHFNLSHLNLSWEKAESMPNKTGNYWLIHLQGKLTFQNVQQGYRKIAFLKDSTGKLQARILEIIPDGITYQRNQRVSTTDFTGRIFIYDEAYHLLSGKVFAGGKQIGQIKPGKATVNTTTAQAKGVRNLEVSISADCEWNDSNYIDGDGVFTVYSELDCSYTIYDNGGGGADLGSGDYAGGGGGGGGAPADAPAVSNLPDENNPKVDPKALMNCFGTIPDAGATMSVTVYVQEPWPGTSFAIGPNSVGHTAIGLSKSGSGSAITQVVGFYPDATGYSKVNAPSKIVSNGGDLTYNASITYNVSAAQFNQIANYIANPPGTYDLSTFNCTDFVMGATQAGGITLPSASSVTGINGATMSLEHSNTPGGLGGSLQNMQGQPGVSNTNGTTPNSHGPCN